MEMTLLKNFKHFFIALAVVYGIALIFIGLNINMESKLPSYVKYEFNKNSFNIEKKSISKHDYVSWSIPKFSLEKKAFENFSCFYQNDNLSCLSDNLKYKFKLKNFDLKQDIVIDKMNHLDYLKRKDFSNQNFAIRYYLYIKRDLDFYMICFLILATIWSGFIIIDYRYEKAFYKKENLVYMKDLEEIQATGKAFTILLFIPSFIAVFAIVMVISFPNSIGAKKDSEIFERLINGHAEEKVLKNITFENNSFEVKSVSGVFSTALTNKIPKNKTIEIKGVEKIDFFLDVKKEINNTFFCSYNKKMLSCQNKKNTYHIILNKKQIFFNSFSLHELFLIEDFKQTDFYKKEVKGKDFPSFGDFLPSKRIFILIFAVSFLLFTLHFSISILSNARKFLEEKGLK